jgi:pyridoxal phosphate enzyme (YggS family)
VTDAPVVVDPGEIRTRAEELAPLVAERLEVVRERITAAGGDLSSVRVVAVTKTFGAEAALAARYAGIGDIGENYADDLVGKAALVRAAIEGEPFGRARLGAPRWHFIGSIQRNKVARLVPVVSFFETLSRRVEAEAIAERLSGSSPRVMIEVNLSDDPTRPGCDPATADSLAGEVRATGLDLVGLMGVAPLGADDATVERAFGSLASIAGRLGLEELSMGMSSDLEAAVRAGATMVRIGTALFGPRHPHAPR